MLQGHKNSVEFSFLAFFKKREEFANFFALVISIYLSPARSTGIGDWQARICMCLWFYNLFFFIIIIIKHGIKYSFLVVWNYSTIWAFFFFGKPFCNSPTRPHLHETIFQVSFLVGVFWSFKVYTSFFLLFFCSLVSSLYFLFLFWHCTFFCSTITSFLKILKKKKRIWGCFLCIPFLHFYKEEDIQKGGRFFSFLNNFLPSLLSFLRFSASSPFLCTTSSICLNLFFFSFLVFLFTFSND